MPNDNVWIFVDDKVDEAKSFAEEITRSQMVSVEVLEPNEARIQLLQKRRHPAGVLMDVDLSAIVDEFGTGPGIAQDIRTKQKAGLAYEFPIVRFSAADPLARNVFGDPSSEDLFELKILKDDVHCKRDLIAAQLAGLTEIYEAIISLSESLEMVDEAMQRIFGESNEVRGNWSHEGLTAKLLTGASHAPHVAAGAFCRLFLIPHGILIDEELLAIRLGVDKEVSGDAWLKLVEECASFIYKGVASRYFPRWWSQGLNEWWFNKIDKSGPMAGKTANERVQLISKATGIDGLATLIDPPEQLNFRPWRFCRLGLESSPPEYIPIDPAESVRITAQADFPVWVEPYSASLKLALRARDDQRLNKKDIDRLSKKYRS